jgi:hypothetical protein
MAIISPSESYFTLAEPIQKNRFVVKIPGLQQMLVSSVTIPTPTSNIIFIDHINVRYPVKGKTTFTQWSFNLRNFIAPSSLQILYEKYRLSHEALSGRDSYVDVYSFDFHVDLLDPSGTTVNRFLIKDAVISTFTGLDFDMSADGLVDITVTGECSSCELEF